MGVCKSRAHFHAYSSNPSHLRKERKKTPIQKLLRERAPKTRKIISRHDIMYILIFYFFLTIIISSIPPPPPPLYLSLSFSLSFSLTRSLSICPSLPLSLYLSLNLFQYPHSSLVPFNLCFPMPVFMSFLRLFDALSLASPWLYLSIIGAYLIMSFCFYLNIYHSVCLEHSQSL